MDYLECTRDGYDATAVEYARRFQCHLDDKPVELAMLSAFAGLVKATGRLAVADVGCGTGATTGRSPRPRRSCWRARGTLLIPRAKPARRSAAVADPTVCASAPRGTLYS
jgi:hypothetical protein